MSVSLEVDGDVGVDGIYLNGFEDGQVVEGGCMEWSRNCTCKRSL